MKQILTYLMLCFLGLTVVDQAESIEIPQAERIVFLGDSITQAGRYIEILETAIVCKYPDSNNTLIPLGLSSETVSGLSEPGHAGGKFPRPDLHERLDRVLDKSKPTLVIACYGMNDGIYYPTGVERTEAFKAGMKKLHQKVIAHGAKILHVTPPVFDPLPIKNRVLPLGLSKYEQPYEGYNEVLDAFSLWLLEMKQTEKWDVLDLHGTMNAALIDKRKSNPQFTFANDGVHPTAEGQLLIANVFLDAWNIQLKADGLPDHPHAQAIDNLIRKKHAILRLAWLSHVGHKRPGVAPGLPIEEALKQAATFDLEIRRLTKSQQAELPSKVGDWNGYPKHEITVAGKTVTIIAPKTTAPGKPWVWHGEFFGHQPAPDIALLGKGFHIVYMKINDMLGCPDAVKLWDECHQTLTSTYGFSQRPALVGLSRGGLYCYNWAIKSPEKVSSIYGDAPVCDFKSWPGGKGKGKGDAQNWKLVLKLWKFPDEATALSAKVNPVDNLEPLAKAKVPLLHVFGDADDVVPWEENTGLIATRYEELGGSITLIRKPGIGHHPHGLKDPTPIVDFIVKHAQ